MTRGHPCSHTSQNALNKLAINLQETSRKAAEPPAPVPPESVPEPVANRVEQMADPWTKRAKHDVSPQQIQELHDDFLRYCQIAMRDCRNNDCAGLAPYVLKTTQHTGRITVKAVATETTAAVLSKLSYCSVSSAECPVTRVPFSVSGHRRAVILPCGCCMSAKAVEQSRKAGVCSVCACSLPSRPVTTEDHHLASLRSDISLQGYFPSECRVLDTKDLARFGCTVQPRATGVGHEITGPGKSKPLRMGRGTYMLFDHKDEGCIVRNVIFQGVCLYL